MQPFRFRLHTLLTLRERARDERRRRLAEAYNAQQVLADREQMLRARQEGLAADVRKTAGPGPVEVDRMMQAIRYDATLKAEAAVLDQQRSLLDAEIDRRREALVAADRDVGVLEKLRERQLARHQHAEALDEIKTLDEVALRTVSLHH